MDEHGYVNDLFLKLCATNIKARECYQGVHPDLEFVDIRGAAFYVSLATYNKVNDDLKPYQRLMGPRKGLILAGHELIKDTRQTMEQLVVDSFVDVLNRKDA